MHNDQTDQSLNDQRLEFAKRPVELVNRFEDQVDDDSSQLQPFINGDDSDDYCDSEAEETGFLLAPWRWRTTAVRGFVQILCDFNEPKRAESQLVGTQQTQKKNHMLERILPSF
ncbi:hypothetical protein E3N88_08386 [Mikania micrantha]|uniref:Uncharacterized protein n=1 Tax=Mikania micrantha TaxID=192012 RepID=A0A5N6PG19_9ASTR|nr:hypothetical protein E3N88_08386 [Mikania micrantha]